MKSIWSNDITRVWSKEVEIKCVNFFREMKHKKIIVFENWAALCLVLGSSNYELSNLGKITQLL